MGNSRAWSTVLGVALALTMGLSTTFAQGETGSSQAMMAETFTLQPGGMATVNFEAWCNDFGAAFPDDIQLPSAVAQPEVQAALAHIMTENYSAAANNALEAQYGLWRVVGATNSPRGGQVAEDVVNAATSIVVQPPQGTSLLEAAQNGQVRIELTSWEAVGDPVQIGAQTDNFYGRGTLMVENTSGQELTLYHPIGALFAPGTQGEQTMTGYATDVEVNNPQPQPSQLPNTSEGQPAPWLPAALAITLLLSTGAFFHHLARRVR